MAPVNGGFNISPQALAEIYGLLIQSERKLTNDAGLRGEPWFKYGIYAPGAYTGYRVKTLPVAAPGQQLFPRDGISMQCSDARSAFRNPDDRWFKGESLKRGIVTFAKKLPRTRSAICIPLRS
jgi:hypothetical protein